MTYTDFECKTCKSGYILNKNYYLKDFSDMTFKNQRDRALTWFYGGLLNDIRFENTDLCQPIEVMNCLKLIDFETCSECDIEYYLTDQKKCKMNPDEVVLHCTVYSSLETCAECEQGYYPNTSGRCTTNSPSAGCSKFSSVIDQCAECNSNTDNYVDTAQNKCSPRTEGKKIPNCGKYNPLADECAACADTFIAITNGTSIQSCWRKVDNCDVHDPQNQDSCLSCDSLYIRVLQDDLYKCALPQGTDLITGCINYS